MSIFVVYEIRFLMRIILYCFVICVFFSGSNLFAKKDTLLNFQPPLDIPLYLSGNFGELRTDHYHSGVDIKTQGVIGKKVYASASGYISRIKVSPWGYGKALYITHPNGYTTVYAHLYRFMPKIDSLVQSWQYAKESFEIDTLLEKSKILSVERGELIALSGNSGSSGGPHLHYEIRKTVTEEPVNPLLMGLKVKDNRLPVIRKLYIYPLAENATINGRREKKVCVVSYQKGRYTLQSKQPLILSGKIGFAIDARDYMSYTKNYYGVYDLQLFIDGGLQHHFTFDTISFEDNRCLNAHIDYEVFVNTKNRVHKAFHEYNHHESFCKVSNNGIIFNDEKWHEVKIQVADVGGKQVELIFSVQGKPMKVQKIEPIYPEWLFYIPNQKQYGNLILKIPSFALFTNYKKWSIDSVPSKHRQAYSMEYKVKECEVPLAKSAKVCIKPFPIAKLLQKKLYVARKTKEKYLALKTKWKDGHLVGSTKTIGCFVVLLDTIAPEIQEWGKRSQKSRVRFKIQDHLSGVKSYNVTVNGKWHPFDYDAKRDLLSFDLARLKKIENRPYKIVVTVTDNCGNKKQLVVGN